MAKKLNEETIKIVERFIAERVARMDKHMRIPENLEAVSELLYYAARKKIFKGADVNDKVDRFIIIGGFMGEVFDDYVESINKIGKKWNLWEVPREQLVEYIAEECDFITIKQRGIISHFPYEALDALWDDIRRAPEVLYRKDDFVGTITTAKVKKAHKAIIKNYLNSEFVIAVLKKNGEEIRGRIASNPDNESREQVFIGFDGYVWDLTKLKSWDSPIYEYEEDALITAAQVFEEWE